MVKIKLIITVVTCVVVMAVIMTLSLTTAHFYHECSDLRRQLNQTSQTVKQLQDEEIRKSEIIQEKEQLLQDLKQAKNWSEVCKIWSKL